MGRVRTAGFRMPPFPARVPIERVRPIVGLLLSEIGEDAATILAERSEVSLRTINNIRRGEVSSINFSTLDKLLTHSRVPYLWLAFADLYYGECPGVDQLREFGELFYGVDIASDDLAEAA
jgi:hypothetical protein